MKTVGVDTDELGWVWLTVDGVRTRPLLGPARVRLHTAALVGHLQGAARLGAAYGPVDSCRELAALLMGQELPGRAWYALTPDGQVTRWLDGQLTVLAVPPVRPRRLRAQFAQALNDVFHLAARMADEPVPAPA